MKTRQTRRYIRDFRVYLHGTVGACEKLTTFVIQFGKGGKRVFHALCTPRTYSYCWASIVSLHDHWRYCWYHLYRRRDIVNESRKFTWVKSGGAVKCRGMVRKIHGYRSDTQRRRLYLLVSFVDSMAENDTFAIPIYTNESSKPTAQLQTTTVIVNFFISA